MRSASARSPAPAPKCGKARTRDATVIGEADRIWRAFGLQPHQVETFKLYAHTDQWRYETLDVAEGLSPTAPAGPWDGALIDYSVRAERMGWLPSAPQLRANPMEVSKQAAAAGMEAKDYVPKSLKSGELNSPVAATLPGTITQTSAFATAIVKGDPQLIGFGAGSQSVYSPSRSTASRATSALVFLGLAFGSATQRIRLAVQSEALPSARFTPIRLDAVAQTNSTPMIAIASTTHHRSNRT